MAANKKHVVVIGAGIIGAATALRLIEDGHRVTLLEPGEPGGTQAASHGNGGFLSPASIIPMSGPGLWRKVPGYLFDPTGALTVRWRHLPRLLPWLVRFLLSGWTAARVERTAAALSQLLNEAPARHAALAASIGRSDLIRHDGLIYAFPDRNAFEADGFSWGLRRKFGVRMRELGAAEMHRLVPALSSAYDFGILLSDGGHCVSPGGYVAALVAAAEARGATLHRGQATGFDLDGDRLRAVMTPTGAIPCDAAVIASGVRAKPLARAAGDRVSLESERGYFVEIAEPAVSIDIPVMPQDGRMANLMTTGGLRASGQVELASADAAPDWRRADILLGHLKRTWPGLAAPSTERSLRRWQGNRPSTPDGKPVIGRARRSAQIIYAFGHGHIGLSSAPMTAEIVAALLADRDPPIDISAFAASRFG